MVHQLRSLTPLRRGLRISPRAISSITSNRSQTTKAAQSNADNSVDATEVTHFDALASTWWDPYGSSRLLHLMNPLRHDFISSCISSGAQQPIPPTTLTYLDIGCGGGIFAESAARLPTTRSVTAIDPSSSVIAVARAHAKQDPSLLEPASPHQEAENRLQHIAQSPTPPPKLTYLNTGIESLSSSHTDEQHHDVVTLFEVLEHVSHPSAFLTSCLPFVKPGGWLVLSTIARTWTSWFTTKLVAEDLTGIVPRGTHDWAKYVQEAELRAWFAKQEQGAWEVRSQGVLYVPGVGWRMVEGGEKWGNYFFAARRKGPMLTNTGATAEGAAFAR